MDKFTLEAVDLGKIYKMHIRHDNSMISPAWYLDKVEVTEFTSHKTYIFHCERWLAKNKDDGKIERSFYVKVKNHFHPIHLSMPSAITFVYIKEKSKYYTNSILVSYVVHLVNIVYLCKYQGKY